MASVDVLQGVGDADHRLLVRREIGEQAHHPLVGAGVQPAGHLVQEQDIGVGHELYREAHPFELSAAQGRGRVDRQTWPCR